MDPKLAFLLAVLHQDRMYHGTYIHDKLLIAFSGSLNAMRGALDSENRAEMDRLMEREVRPGSVEDV